MAPQTAGDALKNDSASLGLLQAGLMRSINVRKI